MNDNLAIPVFNSRVAPLLNVARAFSVSVLSEGVVENHFQVNSTGLSEERILSLFIENNITTVICSAVSRCFAERVSAGGIHLVSGIIGNCDEVVDAYLNNFLKSEKFIMPGCRSRGNGGGRGMGRGNCCRNNKN